MTSSELVQDHHLHRKAVLYIRQSTGHQVLTNLESSKMQRAMRETAQRLGWSDERIEVVETDTGTSAQSTAGRDGYKNLLGLIAMGQVGLVLSYESARLSRNCTDWYPLLDVCAFARCLIADRDGVYDPATSNGRLLLGMKGIVSELELHTLRGRLLAGVQNKAHRGELALALPVGLLRLDDGRVVKNPDVHIQEMIALVFRTFLELGSTTKVLRALHARQLPLPRRHRNQDIVWKPPTLSAVAAILKNPAYAGAFTYGKTRMVRRFDAGQERPPQQRRQPLDQWSVIVHERYPAYVSWDEFLKVQQMLRDNYAEYDRNRTRGVPREGAALLHGIAYCGECGHKLVVQYKKGSRYLCNFTRQQTRVAPVCQYLPADPIDTVVVGSFFEALSPVELDLYDRAVASHRAQQDDITRAQQRELQRLRYEVHLARRQYDRVDPDNRLVAAELERRWEEALRALGAAEERLASEASPLPVISRELRESFASISQSLPDLWNSPTLKRAHRKALLRALIDKVVLHRQGRDQVHIRIVWKGGLVTEIDVAITVRSRSELADNEAMVARALQLEAEGHSDEQIAELLTQQGFRSPKGDKVLASTVQTIRLEHQRIHRFRGPRPRRVEGYLTLPQLAKAISVKTFWLYHLINKGVVKAKRDPTTKLYLFPNTPQTLDHFRALRAQHPPRVSS